MSDREFLELLNLYIDHEIGSDGAARLEAEVASDPRRRELYRQYCRIQKACTLLGEASLPADDKVVVLSRNSRPAFALYGAGLMAAAAAVIFTLVTRAPSGSRPAAAPAEVAVSAPASAPAALAAREEAAGAELRPVLSTRAFAASAPAEAEAWAGESLAWMDRVQIAPIPPMPPAPSSFEGKPILAPQTTPLGRPSEGELNALQFEKNN